MIEIIDTLNLLTWPGAIAVVAISISAAAVLIVFIKSVWG